MPESNLPTSNPQAYISCKNIGSSKNKRPSVFCKLAKKLKTQINRHGQRANMDRIWLGTHSSPEANHLGFCKFFIIFHYRAQIWIFTKIIIFKPFQKSTDRGHKIAIGRYINF
ncbi:MAG: hypothetical protein [Inoviridae sp.]|nr:MAG: hypothetical protein [Inoviridae sp.]